MDYMDRKLHARLVLEPAKLSRCAEEELFYDSFAPRPLRDLVRKMALAISARMRQTFKRRSAMRLIRRSV